jgi:hypothetical protein
MTNLSNERLVKGHDFSHADKANKMGWALAPEGCAFQPTRTSSAALALIASSVLLS